jgi:hypothetical protein
VDILHVAAQHFTVISLLFPHVVQGCGSACVSGHILNLQSICFHTFVKMEYQAGPLAIPKHKKGKPLESDEK